MAGSAGAALKAGDDAFANGELAAAVSLYGRAVQQDPKGVLPLTKRAAAHEKLGEHASALRDLTAALQLDSNATRALLHRLSPSSQLACSLRTAPMCLQLHAY